METPPIRYAKTSDGVSIAYYTLGSGPPLVHLFPHMTSHLTLGWRVPTTRKFVERLAERVTVITLDWRGCGLSQEWTGNLTLDMLHADIQAVLDRLGLRRANFLAWGLAANYLLTFAARYPERVSRLVVGEFNRPNSYLRRAIVSVGEGDPHMAARTLAAIVGGFATSEDVAALAVLHTEGNRSDALFREVARPIDPARLLPPLNIPVLFLHAADDPLMPLAAAQPVVAGLADARLHVVTGNSPLSVQGDTGAIGAVLDFLFESDPELPLEPVPSRAALLSRRQIEVLRLLAMGKTNAEIAEHLVLSLRTVERHIADIYTRLGVRNRTEAVAFALGEGATGLRVNTQI